MPRKATEMTDHLQEAPVQHPGEGAAHTRLDATRSVRKASVIGGIGLLLIIALAPIGNLVVVEGLVTPGDAAKTAEDIMASEGLFRFGVATLYLVVILDVLVAWALLQVFTPVDRGISRLAAWFRLAYAGVFAVAISQLAGVPHLLNSDEYSGGFTEKQLQAQALLKIDEFNDIFFAALILFGVHLALLGYLAFESGYVHKVIGILLVIAGAGYLFDSFGTVLSDAPIIVSTVTFLGEFLLAFWLVIRGRRVALPMVRR